MDWNKRKSLKSYKKDWISRGLNPGQWLNHFSTEAFHIWFKQYLFFKIKLHDIRAEYRPLKPHRDISRYGKCISQCVLNISYKQESPFSISYRGQNLLH